MARKNLFEVAEPAPQQQDSDRRPVGRPLIGFERALKPAAPVGAISQSLETINSRAQRADEIEKKLAAGQAIVELDPNLIEGSFVADRLGMEDDDQAALVAQIKEHGQQVPILLRPHPQKEGRYQVAYGHRRLAAVRKLNQKVRAVVRDLSDEQLVVSQGQENNSRTDLTYIERCYFAARLQDRGFSREIIMAALGVDKAALSRMIALVGRLPAELIEAIGPAGAFGRQRWAELAGMLEERGKKARALKVVQEEGFRSRKSDDRFQTVYSLLKTAPVKPTTLTWSAADGVRPVRITESDTQVTFTFDKRIEPKFGAFVQERLEALYGEYRRRKAQE